MNLRCLSLALALLAGLACGSTVAQPAARQTNLPELWLLAQKNDHPYLAALAQYQADQEVVNLARSALLPVISATVQSGDTRLQQTPINSVNTTSASFQPEVATLRVTVPLFDRERSLASEAAKIQLERATLLQKQVQGELASRLANAYYTELLARESAELAGAQLEALTSQATRASRLYQGGVATLTDVEETAARMQLAKAQLQQSISQIRLRRSALERIVGPLGGLSLVRPAELSPAALLREGLELYIEKLDLANASVLAQKKAVELAKTQVARAQSGHLPTLSLNASRSTGREPSQSIKNEYSTQAAFALNIPIYEGGRVSALSRQQTSLLTKAQSDLDAARADAQSNLRDAYSTLADSRAQTEALGLALKSAQVALEGMLAGQQAGLRTNTDVLNAQQQLYSVRRDILREDLNWRLAALQLRLITGESVSF